MTRREKLRRKLRSQPANATMQDVQSRLERFGFSLARVQGSHHIFEYDDGDQFAQVVVPVHGRKVKKAYVEKVVESLDSLFPPDVEANQRDEDEEDA